MRHGFHGPLAGAFLLAASAALADAHFVFVVPQPDAANALLFLSETLQPSDSVDASLVAGAKLSIRDAQGRETPLMLTPGTRAFTTPLPGSGTRVIHGVDDLGTMQAGDGKSYRLLYYPKTILGNPFDARTILGSASPVEILATGKPGELRLKVVAHGAPQPRSEVTILLPGGGQKKLITNEAGLTDVLRAAGRYGAWARYWDGETRNYATLVLDVPAASNMITSTTATATHFATLPRAASSFGAVASDGWLYVYGGHVAHTHSYSTSAVSGEFNRLKLSNKTWEQLPGGPGLQGMNLALHHGKIYRIGGMSPRNHPGEKEAIYSVADCARFDPAAMKWEPLPALPEPRSSHDVAVAGDQLFVAGGWTLKGPAGEQWLDTMDVLDLTADKLEWKSVRQAFRRRALIAAVLGGRVYVMGGIDDQGVISHEVDIYDPATGVWSKGPDLPGGEVNGFSPAACTYGGKLYVSVADGGLYVLNAAGDGWDKMGEAAPRVAHRIVPFENSILVIGGAAKGSNLDSIDAIALPHR